MSGFVTLAYVVAGLLFVLALRWMSSPTTSRRGVLAGEVGMAIAIVGTLLNAEVVTFEWILVGLFVGTVIGIPMGLFIPMTAMPQRIALSHAFGALAAALVGTSEFYLRTPHVSTFTMSALGLEVLLGFLTFTGSLMAFGKLQGVLPDRPIVYRGQNVVNLTALAAAVGLAVALALDPGRIALFPVMAALALLFGVMLVVPIGGADMPVVISLLNSYAGLSGAAMGFVLGNDVLIIAGSLDGSSGLLLSIIMCRAMNRSFRNVLFGAFGAAAKGQETAVEERPVRASSPDEAAMILDSSRFVVIIPGYGMAVAQAQHKVRELSEALRERGIDVRFAVHPVAGRMPGHMNVLLAEAHVAYDLLWDMDAINPEMDQADVALVIGANDVVNPAAHLQPGSPIFGMPIIEADKAQCVMVIKRSMRPGFAGVDNELFYEPKTMMLFGDARQVVTDLIGELHLLRPAA